MFMNYEDLIREYPYIDLIFELFKGIMPTAVALLAIFLNNSFAKKRDLMYRKKNLQLDYYVKILNWLHEIKNDVMEVSLDLENALNKVNPNEQTNGYNDFMQSISNMNRCIVSWKDTYGVMLEYYNCDIKLSQFKQEMSNFSNSLVKIANQYLNQADTSMATDEINNMVIKANEVADNSIKLLLKEMNALY